MSSCQWAIGDGPIHLTEVWKQPIQATIDLFKMFCEHPGGMVLFNASFDWFHIAQMGTTLLLMNDKSAILEDCVNEYAMKEPEGRDGPCFKPVEPLDLMLHARKGPYQSDHEQRRHPDQEGAIPSQLPPGGRAGPPHPDP